MQLSRGLNFQNLVRDFKSLRFWAGFQDFWTRLQPKLSLYFKNSIRLICISKIFRIIYNYVASYNINIRKNTENMPIFLILRFLGACLEFRTPRGGCGSLGRFVFSLVSERSDAMRNCSNRLFQDNQASGFLRSN